MYKWAKCTNGHNGHKDTQEDRQDIEIHRYEQKRQKDNTIRIYE